MIRLIVIDVSGPIAERNGAGLRNAERRGVFVSLASARTSEELEDAQRELGLHGPLIAERGAQVTGSSGERLLDERILPEVAREVVGRASALDALVAIRVDGRVYIRPRRRRWWERGVPPEPGTEVVDSLVDHIGDGPTLRVVNGRVSRLAAGMPHHAVRSRLLLPGTEAESLIVTPGEGTYAHALRAVQRSLGVARSETLAIVGSEDAHALFEEATVRVARRDADDRIVLSATWHATDAPGDIAAALERFLAA